LPLWTKSGGYDGIGKIDRFGGAAMLRSIIWWIAKTPEPGRETTKLVSST
jgi:hypothetical protein